MYSNFCEPHTWWVLKGCPFVWTSFSWLLLHVLPGRLGMHGREHLFQVIPMWICTTSWLPGPTDASIMFSIGGASTMFSDGRASAVDSSTVPIHISLAMVASSNWDSADPWGSSSQSESSFSVSLCREWQSISCHVWVSSPQMIFLHDSIVASAHVGPSPMGREGQHDQSPHLVLSHLSPKSTCSSKLSVSDSSPMGIPCMSMGECCWCGYTSPVTSYGKGFILFKSLATLALTKSMWKRCLLLAPTGICPSEGHRWTLNPQTLGHAWWCYSTPLHSVSLAKTLAYGCQCWGPFRDSAIALPLTSVSLPQAGRQICPMLLSMAGGVATSSSLHTTTPQMPPRSCWGVSSSHGKGQHCLMTCGGIHVPVAWSWKSWPNY